jgi:hypothetical protein
MNLPPIEQIPDDPTTLPPARRRRQQRLLAPLEADERAAHLDAVARRASPSFDFFLFSLLAGIVISIGLLIDQPALLILGAILAPLMAPAIGVSFGAVTGSGQLFFRSLGGLLIGCLLVLLSGWAAGLFAARLPGSEFVQAHLHSQLSWGNFAILAAGAILSSIATVRGGDGESRWRPAAPSVALAYALYLPLACAGLGLGSHSPYLWPAGLVIFTVHLSWAILLGALTLAFSGFRPLTPFGYTIGGAVALLGVVMLIGLSGAGAVFGYHIGLPTPTPTLTPTLTLTSTATLTPIPPSATPIPPTATLTPTLTFTPIPPTATLTPTMTPVLAMITTGAVEGVRFRAEPGGATIGFLSNGALVIVQPETIDVNGTVWVRITTLDGRTGWILQSLLTLVTATPSATP